MTRIIHRACGHRVATYFGKTPLDENPSLRSVDWVILGRTPVAFSEARLWKCPFCGGMFGVGKRYLAEEVTK